MASSIIPHGPYRATKLWNEVICLFRSGMPIKNHRMRFKLYQDCFTGFDAAEWLHVLLKSNPNFSSNVSRKQTIQLLNKFLKNHVIEDVHGRFGEETFSDNGQLFRFPANKSPLKRFKDSCPSLQTTAKFGNSHQLVQTQKLVLLNNNAMKDATNVRMTKITQQSQKLKLASTSDLTIEQIWKLAFENSLKRILHIHNEDEEILSKLKINVDYLRHNAITSDESGLAVTPSQEVIPCWLLSAMKCLSNWPDSVDTGLPNYEGFEKDVFKAIVDYFQALHEPLLTYSLFQLFTAILVRCDVINHICDGYKHDTAIENVSPSDASATASDRIHKQLLQAQMRHENLAIRRHRSMNKRKQLFSDDDLQLSEFNDGSCVRHSKRDKFTGQKRGSMTAFSASIESLPEISVYDSGRRASTEYSNLKRQPITCKSEGNLLAAGETNHHDLDEISEDMFSSVEDLLLNMSANNQAECDDDYCRECPVFKPPVNPSFAPRNEHAADRQRSQNMAQPNKSRDWIMQLDGLSPKPKVGQKWQKKLSDQLTSSDQVTDGSSAQFLRPESAFGVYHKMSAKPSTLAVDEYETLPWHLNRRNSKVVTRVKQRKNSATAASRNTWYGGEVYRSKSDIVARREVPPTVERMSQCTGTLPQARPSYKLPYVSKGSADLIKQTKASREPTSIKRLSRSQNNLANSQARETCIKPSLSARTRPLSYHRSMDILNEDNELKKQTQSPLSAALEQARINLKVIASRQDKRCHSIEALQMCLLLIPPENRRKLHLLLRMMTKILANPNLTHLDERLSTRDLLVDRFTDSILRCTESSDCVDRSRAERAVSCLLDHSDVVMKVNDELCKSVAEIKSKQENRKATIDAETGGSRSMLKKQFTFCKQLSHAEYQNQNGKPLESALSDLLQAIVHDQKISVREKKKKLKQFRKSHPHIYNAQFPAGDPLTNEKPPRLGGAIRKLKNFRLLESQNNSHWRISSLNNYKHSSRKNLLKS